MLQPLLMVSICLNYLLMKTHLRTCSQELLHTYREEPHILIWQDGKGQVLMRDDASPMDALRAVWQVISRASSCWCSNGWGQML